MDGRQGYFKEFILRAFTGWAPGTCVAVTDLYEAAMAEADPEWIDDEPCKHNGGTQPEWKHELRWALQKLEAEGHVRHQRNCWVLT